MKFFRKTPVAVLLTALLVALCCVWGYSRVYVSAPPNAITQETDHHNAGESDLNYYISQIDDQAHLFSLDTVDAMARFNLDLDSTYNSMLVIETRGYLNNQDIGDFAQQRMDELDLSPYDLYLLLDTFDKDWYVAYDPAFKIYAEKDDTLPALFRRHFTEEFFTENTDMEMLAFFGNLTAWYEDHVPEVSSGPNPIFQTSGIIPTVTLSGVVRGIVFTLLANVWWIILLMLILNGVDRFRLSRYLSRPPAARTAAFRPLLFWHRPGSKWYDRMTDPEYTGDDETAGFGGEDGPGAGPQASGSPGGEQPGSGSGFGASGFSGNGSGFGSQDSGYTGDQGFGSEQAGPNPGFGGSANFTGGAYDAPGGFVGGPNDFGHPSAAHGLWNRWKRVVDSFWDTISGRHY